MKRTKGYFRWPMIIVGMLAAHVSVMAIAVTLATRPSPGAAVIDNYYQKAVHWDQTKSQRSHTIGDANVPAEEGMR